MRQLLGLVARGASGGFGMKVTSIIAAVAGAIFRVVAAVAVVYLIYQGAGICYDYGYRIFTEPAMTVGEGRTVTVSITEDMSALEIGELLESRGLVRDAKLFVLQYYLSEYIKDVKPGTFELSTAMTVEDMMAVMAETDEEGAAEGGSLQGNGSSSGSGTSSGDNGASDENASGEEGMPPAGGAAPGENLGGD